jgi:uncharacterized protein YecE (DUF72 family)
MKRIGADEANRNMIHIGTSGYSYPDWVGHFYPPTLHHKHWLEFYAQRFNTTELNVTFYSLLSPAAIGGMINKVETGFQFFIKAHRDLTHGTRRNAKETMKKFIGTADLFNQAEKLAGVLFQFPPDFRRTGDHEDHLRWAVESLEPHRVAVEFRHASWIDEKTMDVLRELRAAYCIVDMPQVKNFPSSRIEVTADFTYLRFHGQNKKEWASTKSSRNARYDYEYSPEEIKSWGEVVRKLANGVKDTYIYYNNHYNAKAAKNATALQKLLHLPPIPSAQSS